ncbi:MAG: glycosyltransferase family 2 protein [Betaproteobacteria bacterium]
MSTYQGDQFVADQIQSILDQLPANGRILIRDDGSRDRTVEIVEAVGDSRISISHGTNVGFAQSFMALIQAVPEDADVIMVADQDDIWLQGKIARAARCLQGRDAVPTLYCSRLQLVDRDLNPLRLSNAWPSGPSFQNALAENIVIGCTAAFNRAALKLIQRQGDVRMIYFHDWWFYIVVSAFGTVHADTEPTVLYRQHGGNAIGMGSGAQSLIGKLRFLGNADWVHGMFSQIDNFRSVFLADLSNDQVRLLDRYFDHRKPLAIARLVFALRRFRQRPFDEILLRALLGYYALSGRGLVSPTAQARKDSERQA